MLYKKKTENVHCMTNVEITRSLHSFCKSYLDIVYNLYMYSAVFDCPETMVFTMCVSLERRPFKGCNILS